MLSKNVQLVIRDALMEAHRRRHDLLTVEHVLFALTNSMKGRIILEGSGASVPVLREQLEEFFNKELETVSLAEKHEVAQTDSVQRVLERALAHIRSAGRDAVELGDLLISIMDEEESYAHFYLRKQGVEIDALEAGDWSGLPGHTFVRGFVRNYARLLRLDPDVLVGQLDPRLMPELPRLDVSSSISA